MLHHLWQGDTRAAERCQREAELLRIQSTSARPSAGTHLLGEIAAHAHRRRSDRRQASGRVRSSCRPSAHPAWVPVLHYARGEYPPHPRRLRQRARRVRDRALADGAGLPPDLGAHRRRARARAVRARALPEASAGGERYLAFADQRALGYVRNYLRMPLALADAALGNHACAATTAETIIDSFQSLGTTGLNLAVAFEKSRQGSARCQ